MQDQLDQYKTNDEVVETDQLGQRFHYWSELILKCSHFYICSDGSVPPLASIAAEGVNAMGR